MVQTCVILLEVGLGLKTNLSSRLISDSKAFLLGLGLDGQGILFIKTGL